MKPPPLTRIMCVEDDPDIQEVTRLALEMVGGFQVCMCISGPEALAHAEEFRPDLILLDVMMPEMDGPTTLTELRRLPPTRATPVVFMTAKVRSQEVTEYHRMGAIDVVFKPYDPMTLCATLNSLWARHHG